MATRTTPLARAVSKTVAQHREARRTTERVEVQKRLSFIDWALAVPEPKTGRLDFDRYPFQRALYAGNPLAVRERVIKKATQVGISAYLVRETMFWADELGWTALYVFPKLAQLYDFSDQRVRPLILGSEYLRGRVPRQHVQNKGLKQIGRGFVNYRGSESKEGLDSVDADALALDEYDTIVQANIPDAERRITGSLHGLIRRVGVPSIPEWGIARLYTESDRRQWMVKCGCGEWQTISYHENVDEQRVLVVCRRCTKPLDVAGGGWVAEFPDRDVEGFHVPRLIVPHVARNEAGSLSQIVKASKAREPYKVQVHHNKDLGMEYAPEEGRLSREALAAAQSAGGGYTQGPRDLGYMGQNLVTMGVDVHSAHALNVRISEHFATDKKRALFIGTIESFDELNALMPRYSVNMAVIDHLPEMRLAQGFADRWAGMAYLCVFAPKQRDVLTVDHDQRRVIVRRTEAIDAAFTMIREQRNHLPLDVPDDYFRQMMAPIRYVEEDELGRIVVGYRSTGADHYAFSEVYDVLATEAWWIRQTVEAEFRETFVRLEDRMEFQRSAVGEDESVYREGPDEGQWGEDSAPGPDVGEWEEPPY